MFLVTGAVNLQLPLYATLARDGGTLLLFGALLAGTSTHGFGYLGGLAAVTRLDASPARAVSGYFLVAYVGFGVPSVLMGAAVDGVGASRALMGLAGLTGLAGVALALAASRE